MGNQNRVRRDAHGRIKRNSHGRPTGFYPGPRSRLARQKQGLEPWPSSKENSTP